MNERPTIDSITFETSLDHITNPPAAMWDAWRATLQTLAPDLLDMCMDERAAAGVAE